MKTFVFKNFLAGWTPSDSFNAARGLLCMSALELDVNGELALTGGKKNILTGFANNLHTIFSKFLGSSQYIYSGDTTGKVFRATTQIATGGSGSRIGFGYAFDYVFAYSGNKRVRDDGTTTTDLGVSQPSAPAAAVGTAGVNTGVYKYYQVNVFTNGKYQTKSQISASTSVTLAAQYATITPNNVAGTANEVWIFRQGGTLTVPMRVRRITSSYTTPFNDTISDQDALDIGISANLLAVTVNSTDLPETILDVCGPLNGRMVLCSGTTVYLTETNSPESYVPGQAFGFSGSSSAGSELFLFCKKLGDNSAAICTTKDIYILTGTFISLPDGTLDAYLRPLGVKYPPISQDGDIYNGAIVYMSSNGPRMTAPSGQSILLADDRMDRLYRGNSVAPAGSGTLFTGAGSESSGVPIYPYPALDPASAAIRYSIVVSRDKVWCRVPTIASNNPASGFSNALHVYDFKRNTWRNMGTTLDFLYAQEDGAIIGSYNADHTVKELNNQFQKTDDIGGGTNQTFLLLLPVLDFGNPRTRKDWFTLRMKIATGGSNVTVSYSTDEGVTFTSLGTVSSATLTEITVSLSGLSIANTIQFKLSGTVADFRLVDLAIEYDERPEPTTKIFIPRVDLPEGVEGKKFKISVFQCLLDTLGNDVTLTLTVDNSDIIATTLNSAYKKVHSVYLTSSQTVNDLSYKIVGTNPFEYYGMLPLDFERVYPQGRKYHALGPVDLARYGKVKLLRFRLSAESTGDITGTFFWQDVTGTTVTITVAAVGENIYEIAVPLTTAGRIFRLDLSASFVFYINTVQIQAMKTGRETEYEWVDVDFVYAAN